MRNRLASMGQWKYYRYPKAGLPPYTYRWDRGMEERAIYDLKSGTYTIYVTDVKGCTASRQISLGEPPPLLPLSTARSKLCNGETNGILEFLAEGGTPPYQYSIDNGLQFTQQTGRQNLPLGNYNILIRDANGCEVQQNISIPQPVVIELYPPEPARIPLGASVSVEIWTNTTEMLTYAWMPEAEILCPTCPETEILPLRNTVYTITATDPDGCLWSANWSVEVFKEPDVYIPNAFLPMVMD